MVSIKELQDRMFPQVKLYHFTCEHCAAGICEDGVIFPGEQHPLLPERLVWMTSDPNASRAALGLSSHSLSCDRMTHRFTIEQPIRAMHWSEYRRRLLPGVRQAFESAHGTRPDLWWVSTNAQENLGEADAGVPVFSSGIAGTPAYGSTAIPLPVSGVSAPLIGSEAADSARHRPQ